MDVDPAPSRISWSELMDSIFSFSGALVLLLMAGGTIISLITAVVLIALVGLNERLKSIGR